MKPPDKPSFTRREFLVIGSTAAVAIPPLVSGQSAATAQTLPAKPETAVPFKVSFNVNGEDRELEVDTRMTLLDALRENLRLTGTKKGCDQGQCGACTVMVGGRRINSCLSLAVMHQGDKITTIEGLGTLDDLHPMQSAFVKCDGFQCGFCTPGQICSAVAMLEEVKAGIPSHETADLTEPVPATADEFRERMSGNLCRCGAYSNILEAITEVATKSP